MKIYGIIPLLLVLLSSVLRADLIEKKVKSNVAGIVIKHVYRGDRKIVEVSSPTKNAPAIYVNTTYKIIVDNVPLYEYQTSKSGASFQRLNFADLKHAVKLHSTPNGMVDKIFVYTANARETVEAFHIKDSKLIPFSDEELAKHQLNPNQTGTTNPRYWNYFWVRGSDAIDVALFNYGLLLKVEGNGGLRGFEVAGKDGEFKKATAKISHQITEDSKLNVSWINLKSAQVPEPLYIRYAQGKQQTPANLVNAYGEKALPFQTMSQDASSLE